MAWSLPTRKRAADLPATARLPIACGDPKATGVSSDEALMQAYAGGDTEAFAQLYERHKAALYRYLLRGVGDRALAEELYQDVWLRLIQARAGYRPRARFSAWLFTMAHHRMVDHYRSARRMEHDPPEPAAPVHDQPDAQAENQDRGARLRAAIAGLPFEQREAFLLREERGLSLAEIASVTGVNPETAKSRLRYAVAKLREVLHDETV